MKRSRGWEAYKQDQRVVSWSLVDGYTGSPQTTPVAVPVKDGEPSSFVFFDEEPMSPNGIGYGTYFPRINMKKKSKKAAAKADPDILESINSEFGDGTILNMGGVPARDYEIFSTGSLRLDDALGIGGLPRGRITEIFGPESSGKTTLMLHLIADAMASGHRCAFIDAEHALDTKYAAALGVDLSLLAVCQPDDGEQGLNVCERLVRSEKFAVIVVDSVAALVPKKELEGEVGDHHVGVQARMMSQSLRKLTPAVSTSNTLLAFVNQTRSKIGVQWGSPETTTGGNALKFYASVRLRISRIGSNEQGGQRVSNKTRVKVLKNKCAPPFREAEFEIDFGTGISQEGEIIDLAIEKEILVKSGAWIRLADGTNIAQGKENAKTCLKTKPELKLDLLKQIRSLSAT